MVELRLRAILSLLFIFLPLRPILLYLYFPCPVLYLLLCPYLPYRVALPLTLSRLANGPAAPPPRPPDLGVRVRARTINIFVDTHPSRGVSFFIWSPDLELVTLPF